MIYGKEKTFIENLFSDIAQNKSWETLDKVMQKSEFDLVTTVDLNIEDYIVERLRESFPHDTIISEEKYNKEKIIGRGWTIDPIDGTCNLAHGIPFYGIQLALMEDGDVVASGVYLPQFDERYIAVKNGGCELNGRLLRCNKNTKLHNCILSIGDYSHKKENIALSQHKFIGLIYPEIAKIRMFGAACHDFTFVAGERTDATMILTDNIWDIAPGVLICRESGALVTDLRGGAFTFNGDGVIACANQELMNTIISCVKKAGFDNESR